LRQNFIPNGAKNSPRTLMTSGSSFGFWRMTRFS
jgi:hypothetical protein